MINGHFMRIILFFDLPVGTSQEVRKYRQFVKYLESDDFIRIQYSVYCKLCINADSVKTYTKRVTKQCPDYGDIRLIVVTEQQYQSITNVNESYSLQESITTSDRCIVIGGMNNENQN